MEKVAMDENKDRLNDQNGISGSGEQYEPELFSPGDPAAENPDSPEQNSSNNNHYFTENGEKRKTVSGAGIFSHLSEENWDRMDFSALPRTENAAGSGIGNTGRVNPGSKDMDDEIPVCTIPLEKRNQLFSQPHVDLSQLPPPQSDKVITQRISDKVLKKQPLVFSEKYPLPTRGGKRDEQESENEKDEMPVQSVSKTVVLDPNLLDNETVSFGFLLKTARQEAGMTEEQAAAKTKISINYICGLEQDHIDSDLPDIFVSAYVQTLCRTYKVDPEGTA